MIWRTRNATTYVTYDLSWVTQFAPVRVPKINQLAQIISLHGEPNGMRGSAETNEIAGMKVSKAVRVSLHNDTYRSPKIHAT